MRLGAACCGGPGPSSILAAVLRRQDWNSGPCDAIRCCSRPGQVLYWQQFCGSRTGAAAHVTPSGVAAGRARLYTGSSFAAAVGLEQRFMWRLAAGCAVLYTSGSLAAAGKELGRGRAVQQVVRKPGGREVVGASISGDVAGVGSGGVAGVRSASMAVRRGQKMKTVLRNLVEGAGIAGSASH